VATPIKVRTIRQDQVVGTQTINDLFANDAALDAAITALASEVGNVNADLSGLEGRIDAAELEVATAVATATAAQDTAGSAATMAASAASEASAAKTQAIAAAAGVAGLDPRIAAAEATLSGHEERLVVLEAVARREGAASGVVAYSGSAYSLLVSTGIASVAKLGTGVCRVTFDLNYGSSAYLVLATPRGGQPLFVSVDPETGNDALVRIWDKTGAPVDAGFSLSAWKP